MLLTAIFLTASATDQDHECQGGNNCNDGGDVSADADSSSTAESYSGAESSSGATATAGGDVIVTTTRPKSTTLRNVVGPDTPNVYPSAPCRIAVSAGLSLAGGAISGGSSVEDVECTLRETARTFQYLGVPEVGLYLMCQQSAVVNGRYDKKGKLEKGVTAPIGTAECLRLVREFQGDVDESDAAATLQTEIEILREEQDSLKQYVTEQVANAEQEHEEAQQIAARRAPPQVTQQTIQQPMLNDDKRSKLQALFNEEVEEVEETEK